MRFTHVEIPIIPGEEPAWLTLVGEEDNVRGDGVFVEHAFVKCLGGLVSVVMREMRAMRVVLPDQQDHNSVLVQCKAAGGGSRR
ncbi:hypothetical protein GUJ93_ZPchr0012g21527 [Zizania palustris]|uniref:Uncharacterized protein n=1 Tax=Zizania palustris TaxID=103762 RepID=A0A8J6BTB4_ZIZPA|nr:hypothetical protein GUJ93_ZPchr0012g21527 [Zizania palustris]